MRLALSEAEGLTPTTGSAPLRVSFTDTSTPSGAADCWHWAFGDGGVSTAQHPQYTYGTAGTFSVTLTVTDTDTGAWSQRVYTSPISVGQGPTTTRTITYTYDVVGMRHNFA